MSDSQRQVRVFVSSTFRDMHAERDHLVTVVFPELRERVERLGLAFYDVDLRWGVPRLGVDGESANSWEYCKQWIDRVEPFFVCILGQRYGWIPGAEALRDATDRARYAGRSVTEMEIRHAVLSGHLQRRSFFYFRRTRVPEDADQAVLSQFVDRGHSDRLERLKNEIELYSGHPVRRYDCHWTGAGFADLDGFGQAVLEDLWSGVLRDERYVPKSAWREALGRDPDRDSLYTDASLPIAPAVWEKVVECAKPAPRAPLDAEAHAMAEFAAGRLQWFRGRQRELAALRRFAGEAGPDASRLCVLRAVPGQGKSALLAKFAQSPGSSSDGTRPTPVLISHFVGATEQSADPHELAGRLARELERHDISVLEGHTQPSDFCGQLAARLERYDGERLVILVVDGVNQLTLAARDDELTSERPALPWLPHTLGPKVRVILSCASDDGLPPHSPEHQLLSAFAARRPAPTWIDLLPLGQADVREIVAGYLSEYCKELDVEHLDMICAMDAARKPLYLLVMLRELRTLGGNDLNHEVPRLIAELRQERPGAVQLFDWVLERLEALGPRAVALWCGYLALGRVGLSGEELAGLLSKQMGAGGVQVARRIERGLRPYLQRRGAQLDYFHGQLVTAVRRRYLGTDHVLSIEGLALRAHMEAFFRDRADQSRDGSFEGENPRDLKEMLHQQTAGGFWNGLDETARAFAALLERDAGQTLLLCRQVFAMLEDVADSGAADAGTARELAQKAKALVDAAGVVEQVSSVLRGAYDCERASLRAGTHIRWAVRKINDWLTIVLGWFELLDLKFRHSKSLSPFEDPIKKLLNRLGVTTGRMLRSLRALYFQSNTWRYDELYAVVGCSVMKNWGMKYAARSAVLPGERECELMARAEHERWCREMRAHGWTSGPSDPARKQDNRLVSWTELDAGARDDLVRLVQALPAVLAERDFVITRVEK